MSEIEFKTTIDGSRIIRLPAEFDLPQGDVVVVVRAAPTAVQPPVDLPAQDTSRPMHAWLLDLAAKIEAENPDLPNDMAENHDYYAHGKPRHE